MINISHLTKTYNGSKVLDDVTLNIGRNQVVSIIGYSGSGKSTLIKCIAGLIQSDSGSITTAIPLNQGYGGIGMVFDKGNLFPHLTIMQNLVLAPIKVLGIPQEKAEEQAAEILDRVGIWSLRDEYPESLSSGQSQRAAIARSLMMNPKILLLDEPTSSLDPASASEVFKVLSDLRNQDITIVLVTHNINFARSISDRIVFMNDGKVCEQGTPSEIILNPKDRHTKSFINHCVNLVYDIPASKYDLPELSARIEIFCMRYRLSFSDTYSLQLAVEELMNLIPLDNGVGLVITKTDKGVDIEATLAKRDTPYLSQQDMDDDLGYTILSGLCEKIDEATNEFNQSVIRLSIKQNSL